MHKSKLFMPFAIVEFSEGNAFRCLHMVDNEQKDCDGVFCLEIGRPFHIQRKKYEDGAKDIVGERFLLMQKQLNERVLRAQTMRTEVEGLKIPCPIDKDLTAKQKAAREKLMQPLFDSQNMETEVAPVSQKFWVVTVFSSCDAAHLIVHGAHASNVLAEKHAHKVIDDGIVTDADVLSARSWFAVADFATTDIARTTYVNDSHMNNTMHIAHVKSEMAKAIAEGARAAGHEIPEPDTPGFVLAPELKATIKEETKV